MFQLKHIKYGFILVFVFSVLVLLTLLGPVREQQPVVKEMKKDWRLTKSHRQLLASVLSRIQTSYKVNSTPDVSTPPVLVFYSCHQIKCGTMAERMWHVAHIYYFALLQSPDTAFAYDMRMPVTWESYFEPSPGSMAMLTPQADFYLASAQTVVGLESLKGPVSEGVFRVSGSRGRLNDTQGDRQGRFGLGHLPFESDWFFVVSRLLFQRPSDWLVQSLTPYAHWLGPIRLNEGLDAQDPANRLTPAAVDFVRVGLRLTAMPAPGLIQHLKTLNTTRVFVSATRPDYLHTLRQTLPTWSIEAVGSSYPFDDLDSSRKPQLPALQQYARTFMDYSILSRTDILLGDEPDDLFFRLVAWSAQVSTLVLAPDKHSMISFMDW